MYSLLAAVLYYRRKTIDTVEGGCIETNIVLLKLLPVCYRAEFALVPKRTHAVAKVAVVTFLGNSLGCICWWDFQKRKNG
jgi:hypothetical protein